MTPDSTAETCEGAAAWAPGSQKCSGTAPALRPNPSSASTSATVCAVPGIDCPRPSSSNELPVGVRTEGGEHADEGEGAQVGEHDVDQARPPHLGLLVLEHDEQVGADRAMTSHADRNGTIDWAVTTPISPTSRSAKSAWATGDRPMRPLGAEVPDAEDAGAGTDAEDRQEEPGGERIEAEGPGSTGQRAGQCHPGTGPPPRTDRRNLRQAGRRPGEQQGDIEPIGQDWPPAAAAPRRRPHRG